MSRQGGPADGAVRLTRWSVTSGSAAQSRGVVVIEGGDHHWRASATGNGAVDALFRAVDDALADILEGHPRLVSYDVHAVAQGPDAEGRVTVAILPPEGSGGARPGGPYSGDVQGTNIIAAGGARSARHEHGSFNLGAWHCGRS